MNSVFVLSTVFHLPLPARLRVICIILDSTHTIEGDFFRLLLVAHLLNIPHFNVTPHSVLYLKVDIHLLDSLLVEAEHSGYLLFLGVDKIALSFH